LVLTFGANEPPRYLKLWGPFGNHEQEEGTFQDNNQLKVLFTWLRESPVDDEAPFPADTSPTDEGDDSGYQELFKALVDRE
jgi:hypothetical protein